MEYQNDWMSKWVTYLHKHPFELYEISQAPKFDTTQFITNKLMDYWGKCSCDEEEEHTITTCLNQKVTFGRKHFREFYLIIDKTEIIFDYHDINNRSKITQINNLN